MTVYPVKSTAGSSRTVVEVEPAGLVHDRRWMVVDPAGATIDARGSHRLLAVAATTRGDGGLDLRAPGHPSLAVARPVGGERTVVGLSRLTYAVVAPAATQWFTDVLRRPARLVWQDDPRQRVVAAGHGGRGGEPLTLADAGPILLTTSASLRQLNRWIAVDHPQAPPLPMARFRPNIVVDGVDTPFVEDSWAGVRVGDVDLRFGEHCDRCVVTTVDPATLATGPEPIRTLARHRRWDGHVWFGIRLIPTGSGRIAVGDPVTVGEPEEASG